MSTTAFAFIEAVTICALVVVGGFALFALWLIIIARRARARVDSVRERLGPLSEAQLSEIMRTPTHPDSQFALAELMQRGAGARPTKDQLFGMLTSGNSVICGHAMANLQVFYPELVIPDGASNLDPPELWESRIKALQTG